MPRLATGQSSKLFGLQKAHPSPQLSPLFFITTTTTLFVTTFNSHRHHAQHHLRHIFKNHASPLALVPVTLDKQVSEKRALFAPLLHHNNHSIARHHLHQSQTPRAAAASPPYLQEPSTAARVCASNFRQASFQRTHNFKDASLLFSHLHAIDTLHKPCTFAITLSETHKMSRRAIELSALVHELRAETGAAQRRLPDMVIQEDEVDIMYENASYIYAMICKGQQGRFNPYVTKMVTARKTHCPEAAFVAILVKNGKTLDEAFTLSEKILNACNLLSADDNEVCD